MSPSTIVRVLTEDASSQWTPEQPVQCRRKSQLGKELQLIDDAAKRLAKNHLILKYMLIYGRYLLPATHVIY